MIQLLLFAAALQLPAGVKVEGAPMAVERFTDKTGEHVVIITETTVTDGTKALYGYQFVKKGAAWSQLWKTQDYVKSCELDLVLSYVEGSLAISDLDDDGEKESLFAYTQTCTGDVSPLDLKVLMHEGATKYAVRGKTRVKVGENEYAGGESKPDGFDKAPPAFLKAAMAVFKKAANPGN